jgi:uncharacterized membrane protein
MFNLEGSMKRYLFPALAILAGLTACGPPAGSPTGAVSGAGEPADAPASAPEAAESGAFAGDFNLRGTEPFWLLTIRPDRLVLSRPDEGDFTAPNNGPQVSGDSVRWDSGPLDVEMKAETCSDGMSDQVYAYSATVEIEGVATLKGCGLRPDEPPSGQ